MAWEFEGLFDQVIEGGPEEQMSFWRSIPSDIRVGKMGYRTRTTKAGPRLEAEIYPMYGREKTGRLRAEKKNMTPEKVARLNRERSERHFILLVDGNFSEEDIHLGMEPVKYAGAIEGGADGTRERIHVHIVMNGGIDRETLETIWAKGYANADRLRPDENGLEAVARYIIKQSRTGKEKFKKRWFASRNLKQPKTRTSDTKVTNAKVRKIAGDMLNEARAIMEKVYPGYEFTKCAVHGSDVVDGVYIRVVMRERKGRGAMRGGGRG